jgi:L-cysteine:1D-myo-inositol 2-amino-2-deoxy-alpha-D-glucopyranoside ligase
MRSWPEPYLPPAGTTRHPYLKLIDSYTKQAIEFDQQRVTTYICGITPYDATHLGHAATYLTFDIVHRYLIASGVDVNFVENITDIDDPLLERANRDAQDWEELAESQIDLFRSDMTALRVLPPDHYCGVVESMESIIADINALISKGVTYALSGDIYLDLSQIPEALENLPLSESQAIEIFAARGGDPYKPGKRHPLDTLLWQARRANEPFWKSPFGEGRPGWHIECVSIATRNSNPLNSHLISLQGGGSDLIFPHHYMTGVQARALKNQKFAGAYIHTGMIGLAGEKMSKSKGNLIFVSKLLADGVEPAALRLALLYRGYQTDVMWSDQLLNQANELISRIRSNLAREEVAPPGPFIQRMVDVLANNLDVPSAIDEILDWCTATEEGNTGGSAGEVSRALDLYLGIAL